MFLFERKAEGNGRAKTQMKMIWFTEQCSLRDIFSFGSRAARVAPHNWCPTLQRAAAAGSGILKSLLSLS